MEAAEFIKGLYSKQPKPLYLSQLGKLLKENGYKVDNLKEFIELMDGFTVACGPEKERTAIAAAKDKEEIENILNANSKNSNSEQVKFLSELPNTFLYAFASKKKAQPSIYIMTDPPFKYSVVKDVDSMTEIPNDFLTDAKIPANLKQLEPGIVEKLYTNIKRWLEENKLPTPIFIKEVHQIYKEKETTLLEEMIKAIPPNMRSKVVLPLDIIGFLLNNR